MKAGVKEGDRIIKVSDPCALATSCQAAAELGCYHEREHGGTR